VTYDASEQDDLLNRFMEELRKPTGDGGRKRARAEKPPWYEDDSHHAAAMRHYARWLSGEKVDPQSGGHPLAHSAWRLLAQACIEIGNVPLDVNWYSCYGEDMNHDADREGWQ